MTRIVLDNTKKFICYNHQHQYVQKPQCFENSHRRSPRVIIVGRKLQISVKIVDIGSN